jgi:excisionase family DNA binding protein
MEIPEQFLDALADKIATRLAARLPATGNAASKQRLLTVDMAAKYLGRSKGAVQALIHDRRLPIVRLDRRVFLDIRDLDSMIDSAKE